MSIFLKNRKIISILLEFSLLLIFSCMSIEEYRKQYKSELNVTSSNETAKSSSSVDNIIAYYLYFLSRVRLIENYKILYQSYYGAIIVAGDGQYLGRISNQFDPDSIINPFGVYGSKYSLTSIWNNYCIYGGQYGMYSPFNNFAINPPKVFKNGTFLGYLTVNNLLMPRIDPYLLLYFLVYNFS